MNHIIMGALPDHLREGASILQELPPYATQQGSERRIYYSGDGNYERAVVQTTAEEYSAYLTVLEANGFCKQAENAIGDSRFATYLSADGTHMLFISYYPAERCVRTVYGPKGFLPSEQAPKKPSVCIKPSVSQLGRLGNYQKGNGAPGLCDVIQLADGSYILIDGGPADHTVYPKRKVNGAWVEEDPTESCDKELLYRFLCDRNPISGKPVITAWFMTHAHSDHGDMAAEFMREYRDRIDLRMIAFNFPDFDTIEIKGEHPKWMATVAENFRREAAACGAKAWVYHTGQKMAFPGCEVEIVYTQEDFYPYRHEDVFYFPWGNHTSAAYRFTFADKTFLTLGDCEQWLCRHMAENYGTALKSDILQVTHHGANGGYLPLYRVIDPDICFWPTQQYAFEVAPDNLGTIEGYEFNQWLRDDRTDPDSGTRPRLHYAADSTVTIPCELSPSVFCTLPSGEGDQDK
ncbi:MAG: hypothetical protein E7668_07175 [Ruminococcaceae bacterium]|nr:hypothetical protein [Oscillospiraceae bacterium]